VPADGAAVAAQESSMQVGVAGYHGAGKTTVFNCLTGADAATGYGGARETNRAVITVPDERVDRLSAMFEPKKTTPATVTFVDLPPADPGGEGGGIDRRSADELGNMEALVHVVRGFGAEQGLPPRGEVVDPGRDLADFDTELGLLDLMMLEGRLERLKKEGKPSREREILETLVPQMDGGERPLRTLEVDQQARTVLSGFRLLSLLPQMALVSLADDAAASEAEALADRLRALGEPRAIAVMTMRPNIERELSELAADEQQAFLADLGLDEAARPRFIRACYRMLDRISFFTVGPDEVRAWTIARGTTASVAAGKIHSDLERGFIRAETISYDELMVLGSLGKARGAGKLRLEGKDYLVQDGDIINVRFNV